jgi:hypothetical protein
MAWASLWTLGVFSMLVRRRLNAGILVVATFIATVFIVDMPFIPGLNTLRASLLMGLALSIFSPMRLNKYYVTFLGVFSIYVLFLSVNSLGLQIPAQWERIGLGFFQTPPIRNLLSTFFFLLSALTFVIAYNAKNPMVVIQQTLRWFLIVATVAGLFALLQIVINIFTAALNPFFAVFSKAIILEGSGFLRLRPSVFVYEPRYFAVAMGLGLFLLVLNDRQVLFPISRKRRLLLMGLFASMMLFAASTSAIVTIGAGLLAFYVADLKRRGALLKFGVFLAMAVILFFALRSLDLLIVDRFNLYIDRIQNAHLATDQMAPLAVLAYVDWLRSLPPGELLFGKGLGNSAYFAIEFISSSSALAEKGFFSARINVFDLIGDLGLVGFIVLHAIWFLLLVKLNPRALSQHKGQMLRRMKLLCVFLIGVNLSYVCYTLIWLSLGLCYNLYASELRDQSTPP